MRIISKFHDYYDCIQKHGQDDLIYHRKEIVIPNKNPYGRSVYFSDNIQWEYGIVGFCGECRLFIDIHAGLLESNRTFCYTPDDVHEFAEDNLRNRVLKLYDAPDRNYRWRSTWTKQQTRKSVDYFFEEWNRNKKHKYDHLFEKHKSPIFIKTERETVINGSLKDIEFYKVFDPYTTFQEISMFLSNIALPEPHILTINDEDLAKSKGFDKFSFRKPPSKKR